MRGQPPVVIVAEDEWIVRLVATEALTEAGFRVIEAEHGESALAALRLHAPAVDVLFTDIQMPGSIDGLQLAKLARALIPQIAVLIGSGNYSPDLSDMPLGSRFFPKPYSLAEIAPRVRALLDEKLA